MVSQLVFRGMRKASMFCSHGLAFAFGSHSRSDFWLSGRAASSMRRLIFLVGSFAKSTEAFLAPSLSLAVMLSALGRLVPTTALCGSTMRLFALSESQWY